ncbi:MAG: glycosyltransferase [Conexivisphaera sp.]
MRASFVIPVGPNEVGISRRAIELRRKLEAGAGGDSAEFLLVSDAPGAGTAEEMRELSGRGFRCYFLTERLGKGGSLRNAVSLASGDVVVLMDADADLDPGVVWRMARYVHAGGAAMAIARRVSRPHGALRMVLSASYNSIANIVLRTGVRDHQAGLKVLEGSVARSVVPRIRTDGFAFDAELIARVSRVGRVVEFPVEWREARDDPGRGSHVVPFRAVLTMLADLLVISYVTVNGSALRAVVIGDVLDAEGRAVAPEVMNVVEWRHPRLMSALRAMHFAVSSGRRHRRR